MGFKLLTNQRHPRFTDLVHNYSLFHDKYSPKDLSKLNWIDHAPLGYYSNYQHIDDLMANPPDNYMDKLHTVRIPISYIYSSEWTFPGGYDRPLWTATAGDRVCRENLNIPNGDGNPRGFKPDHALVLNAWLRPCGDGEYQIVKNMGNNRVWMKLLASQGLDTEIVANVRFHVENDISEYQKIESDNHSTDAGNRSSQNEEQKFISSLRARRKHAVECYEFLRKHNLDYRDIMIIDGLRVPSDDKDTWLSLQSLSGLKDGMSNGFFKKYGEENVVWAIDTMKKIAIDITKEKVLNAETIRSFSIMFYIFTNQGLRIDSRSSIFSKVELQNFLLGFFHDKNVKPSVNPYTDNLKRIQNYYPLKTLSVTLSMKDPILICAKAFWPEIVEYYRDLKGGSNSFDIGCYASYNFTEMADKMVKSMVIAEMRKDVDKL